MNEQTALYLMLCSGITYLVLKGHFAHLANHERARGFLTGSEAYVLATSELSYFFPPFTLMDMCVI
jgi:hypothetical protein